MNTRLASALAAGAWTLLCLAWFDAGRSWRPEWLGAPGILVLLAVVLAAALAVLLRHHGWRLSQLPRGASWRELALFAVLAVAFRLPLASTAAVGYTTPDGSLSGTVALRLLEGTERLVFVPSVPYSGSLKSHLTALLAHAIDLSRAFTLSSVAFYALFVAAVYALAAGLDVGRARLAALYAVFAPAFVTRYSLSNDGNYVEVLALGTLALLFAVRGREADAESRRVLAWAAGLALGLAFWSHILAVIPAAAAGLAFAFVSVAAVPRLLAGFALGALPSLLWNLGNGGESFLYLMPGGQSVGSLESGPPFLARVAGIAVEQWPVLMGYDPGYGAGIDSTLRIFAWLASAAVVAAYAVALRRFAATRDFARGVLLLFSAFNLTIAATSLPYIPDNPRYLLFLVAPIAVFLADAFGTGRSRLLFAALVLGGVAGSLGQLPSAAASDTRWRIFVRDLERAGVRHCYTDFYLAAKINLLSEERVVCAADLGPTTTEYFKDYPERVAAAPRVALIAVNETAADKLARRLARLGVNYERLALMKPVLVPARPVHPSELFPRGE